MIRKQIYIEPEQEQFLKKLSEKTGVTEAELIRRSISALAEHEEEWLVRREAWKHFIDSARAEMAKGPLPGPGRDWTRDDLYDD